MKKSVLSLFLSLVYVVGCNNLFSQTNNYEAKAPVNVSLNKEPSRLMTNRHLWKEDISKRSWFSSTYIKPDSAVVIEYSKRPINYVSTNKKFEPIVLIPSKTAEGDLQASSQIHPVTIKRNGSITVKVSNNTEIVYSNNAKINGIATKSSVFTTDSTQAKLIDVLPNIDKVFDFRLSGAKYNYVIKKPLAKSSDDFVIEEEITIPADAKIKTNEFYGRAGKKGWEGDLSIYTPDNNEIGRILRAQCYDAKGSYCLASYQLDLVDGTQKLKIIVPNSWMNDARRSYPITIDPLVVGPTTVYTGPLVRIPSCEAPAYGSDSILVTIPSNISITGFFVSGSYYADIFGGANKTNGSMFFKTKCSRSGDYKVNPSDPISLLPGAAILTNEDLKNPLNCCIPQSCSTQTLYLVMGISRTYTPGVAGCNDFYIYHNTFDIYPFKCYVEGHTNEQGLASASWKATPNNLCSNTCTITGQVYIKYGVPPYIISHPWTTKTYTVGTASGCSTGFTNKSFTLTVPDCPTYCTGATSLSVPTPTVLDACGTNVVTDLTPVTLTVITTPTVSISPNPLIACSDMPFNASITSCIPSSTLNWSGNGATGTDPLLVDTITNNTGATTSSTYIVTANNKGCVSDPVNLVVNTDPRPAAKYSVAPDPSLAKLPSTFTDESVVPGSVATKWLWSVSTSSFSTNQTAYFIFDNIGTYKVCLAIESQHGCRDTTCKDLKVITANITLPNVITPNGDGVNDYLKIDYLDFFATNNLKIYDRWGRLVYDKTNYDNKWNGDKVSDGTYFIVLTVDDKSYSGFLQVFHNK